MTLLPILSSSVIDLSYSYVIFIKMSIRMNLVKAKRNQNNTSGILFNNEGFFLEERLREVCNASMTDYCSLRTKKKLE